MWRRAASRPSSVRLHLWLVDIQIQPEQMPHLHARRLLVRCCASLCRATAHWLNSQLLGAVTRAVIGCKSDTAAAYFNWTTNTRRTVCLIHKIPIITGWHFCRNACVRIIYDDNSLLYYSISLLLAVLMQNSILKEGLKCYDLRRNVKSRLS